MGTVGKRTALLCVLGALALGAAGVAACVQQTPLPGDEILGTFAFTATESADRDTCGYEELVVDGGVFTFEATLSRQSGTGQAWMVVRGVLRDAGFDGQRFDSFATGPRRFANCGCEGVEVELQEHIAFTLLSNSQAVALNDGCPDGGEPPVNEDAGVYPPRSTPSGFDARRACGEVRDELVPRPEGRVCELADGGVGCQPCVVRYQLEGVRR